MMRKKKGLIIPVQLIRLSVVLSIYVSISICIVDQIQEVSTEANDSNLAKFNRK